MHLIETGNYAARAALAFAAQERRYCLSEREWRHRMRGYGYDIRQTENGAVLARLTTGAEIGALGQNVAAVA